VARLKAAGVEVVTGILAEKQTRLNEAYHKYIVSRIPYITLKAAVSLDGKMATSTGQSHWITSEESRQFSQRLRAEQDGIMVGIKTALADDPELSVRVENFVKKRWFRILLDSSLRLPLAARLLKSPDKGQVLIFTSYNSSDEKAKRLEDRGAEVIRVPDRKGYLSLAAVLKQLGKREITSVLVEGGASLLTSFLEKKLADKAIIFISPLLIGGEKAPTVFEGQGVSRLPRAARLKNIRTFRLNDDLIMEGYF
jgi:diaminohydroxyphosphoribosylaminopyrimidine deaminase/5-amino-6-(5-phosphoribosylamino)uracil reductase